MMTLGYSIHTMSLQHRFGDYGELEYKWVRDDGEDVSPVFHSNHQALEYATKMPFMTEKEWRQRDEKTNSKPISYLWNDVK